MSRYEDFMKNAYIRRFPSGAENQASKGPLKKAFEDEQDYDQSPERMERLKKILKKTEIGRETLDFLDQKGSDLIFEKMPYYGYFSPEENIVALSPRFSDEDLAITFIHEVRHARQDSIMTNTSSDMTPETILKNGFLIEADACAAECVFAHQMMEQGDNSIFEAHQKTAYAPMSTAFEAEFEKSHDWNKAREAAMMAWYDLPVKPGYADQYIDFMKEIVKNNDSADFRNEMDTKKMAQMLCLDSNGECYIQNPKKLESPEKLNVSEKQANTMMQTLKTFIRRQNRPAERLGLDKVYVEHSDGTYTTVREEMKKAKAKEKNNAAVRNAANGKGGR
ncbi:MAG: hypothetical protein J5716_01070 [Alphaproteobacteria bacterium]|nr:hypothetical protein [Alphaproteobacteria bacterium]